jgi:hypothetical protein
MLSKQVIAIAAVIVLGVAAFVGYEAWSGTQAPSSRDSLAGGYETQPLQSPFQLQSKSWQKDHWVYRYMAHESLKQTIADAKAQFGRGAYQVVAGSPDQVSANQATLYRDLITEDVAVTAHISPAPGEVTSVEVQLRPIKG